ncbi:hypothetical protein FQN60_010538, partial [Etheostoma spectabile]
CWNYVGRRRQLRALQPALSQLSRRRVWLSVTALVEEVSVVALSSAGSVLELAAVELLQGLAQREWPVLIPQQDRPSDGPNIHTTTTWILYISDYLRNAEPLKAALCGIKSCCQLPEAACEQLACRGQHRRWTTARPWFE